MRPLLALIVAASAAGPGCGKVGDPLPPLVGGPEAVADLSVEQVGYTLVFRWTNPARNVDQTALEDLDRVVVRANGEIVAEFPTTGPGQPQTLRLEDASDLVGEPVRYTLQSHASRGRSSAVSEPVRITPVEVPGPVSAIRATVDQSRIALEWAPPSVGAELAAAYRIYRSGVRVGESATPGFEDSDFVEGETYRYAIAAVRGGDEPVEGLRSRELSVPAIDATAPRPPEGLRARRLGPSVFLVWEPNQELDVSRYRIFRRASDEGEFVPVVEQATTAFTDPEFQPGYQYSVTAIDRSGNESPPSEPSGP